MNLADWTHEHCECCQRDTPHREGLCIYDGMPSREACAFYFQRMQEFRRQPFIEYRPYDDRYVRIA